MLTICDIGSTNISEPSFSILQGISPEPQAFSESKLLNILCIAYPSSSVLSRVLSDC